MQNYAGFWLRFVAAIIDGIIVFIAQLIVMMPFGLGIGLMGEANSGAATGIGLLINLVVFVLQWLYFAFWKARPCRRRLVKRQWVLS